MPRKQWSDGQEVIEGDLNQGSSALELELYDRYLLKLTKGQQNFCFGTGLLCSNVNATTSKVKAGLGMQHDSSQTDPEPMNRPLYLAADTNVTHTAADGSHNRIDLICVKHDRATTGTANRNYKDPVTGNVTSVSFAIETDWSPDLLVVAGTPASSPSAPSTPSGYLVLAQVLVTASTGISGGSAYTDERTLFQFGSSWASSTGFIAITNGTTAMGHDDEVVSCDGTSGNVTYDLLPAASMTGKKIVIYRKDATGNTVTIQANASETISGANTQGIVNQYTSLTLFCDGTQWIQIA